MSRTRDGLSLLGAVAGRLLWFAALLAGAAVLIEVLLWAAPGDPIDLIPDGEALRPALEARWGLDRSPLQQTVDALVGAAQGDLGISLTVRPGQAVAALVADAGRRSLSLLVPGLLLAMGLGLLTAWLRASRATSPRLLQALSAAPVFLLAWLLVTGINEATFALMQQVTISRPDWFALPLTDTPLRSALAIGVLAIGSGTLSEVHAELWQELLRIRQSGYVQAAQARGEPLAPHILHNLIAPLTTIAASRVGFLVGGLVILEKILLLNGAGSLLWDAALQRDYPLAMGLALAAAVVVCGARLVGDLVRVVVDPRLRASR